jgi:hypothetical protein
MTLDPHDRGGRDERRRVLAALATASADPVRLVQLVQHADGEEATRRVAETFGLEPELAEAVLDQSIRLLTPSRRARVAEELRVLDAEWGPTLELELRFTTGRSATMTVDGTAHTFRGRGPASVRDQALAFVSQQVARPQMRPAVVTVTGLPDGARWAVRPDGSASAEYPGD